MKISFPAMKGYIGKRDYYVAMIKMSLLPKIFSYHDWAELPPEQRAQRILQRNRIPEITQYIIENEDGYIFSSLTASFNGDAVFKPSAESPEIGILELPLDSQFVINDGQHRRAAIVEALKQNPLLTNETISVVFFPYEDIDRMQQMFSDLNRTVKVTSKSLNILYDHRDLLGQVVLDTVEKVSVFKNLVDKDRVSLPLRSPKLFTLSAVYDGCRELVGIVTPENQGEKAEIMNNYWETVGENIQQWKQVKRGDLKPSDIRTEYVHSHAVVIWGLGAMGKSLIEKYSTDWQFQLTRLSEIDWRRTNKEWQEVCMQGTDIVNRVQSRKATASFLKSKLGLLQTQKSQEINLSEILKGLYLKPTANKVGRGNDLKIEFKNKLEIEGIPFKIVKQRGMSPKIISIYQKKCLIAYANLSHDRYWIGFDRDDIVSAEFDYVILLCGNNIYVVPFETFSRFIISGSIDSGGGYNIEVFPYRNNILKVSGNSKDELQMNKFNINSDTLKEEMEKLLLA